MLLNTTFNNLNLVKLIVPIIALINSLLIIKFVILDKYAVSFLFHTFKALPSIMPHLPSNGIGGNFNLTVFILNQFTLGLVVIFIYGFMIRFALGGNSNTRSLTIQYKISIVLGIYLLVTVLTLSIFVSISFDFTAGLAGHINEFMQINQFIHKIFTTIFIAGTTRVETILWVWVKIGYFTILCIWSWFDIRANKVFGDYNNHSFSKIMIQGYYYRAISLVVILVTLRVFNLNLVNTFNLKNWTLNFTLKELFEVYTKTQSMLIVFVILAIVSFLVQLIITELYPDTVNKSGSKALLAISFARLILLMSVFAITVLVFYLRLHLLDSNVVNYVQAGSYRQE